MGASDVPPRQFGGGVVLACEMSGTCGISVKIKTASAIAMWRTCILRIGRDFCCIIENPPVLAKSADTKDHPFMDNIIAGFKYKNANPDGCFDGKAGCRFPAAV
jgi:hypothetical protein